MDAIIQFLEQYWGYTLFGGMSLGTLITFAFVQIKVLLGNKKKGFLVESLMSKLDEQIEKNQNLETTNIALVNQSESFQEVQAVTFKAISYLVLASKLPTEEKLALQEDFSKLKDTLIKQQSTVVKTEVKGIVDKSVEESKELAANVVVETVKQGQSLLEKYVTGDK